MKRLFCAFLLILLVTASCAFASVSIDGTNFSDSIFRKYVSDNFDLDGNGVLSDSEIDAVEKIYVDGMGISSLEGIKFFTNLRTLGCSDNGLTKLDLKNMSNLKRLNCDSNSIGNNLVLDGCSKLEFLACGNIGMDTINVAKFENLEYFSCWSNNLSELDVSSNTKLTSLRCSRNALTQLDVSKNIALMDLACEHNKITTLDLSKNMALKTLSCSSNALTSLTINSNAALKSLSCFNNSLVSLNIPKSEVLSSVNLSPQTIIGLKSTLDNGNYTVDLLNDGYGISASILKKISSVIAYDTNNAIIATVASNDTKGIYSFSEIPVILSYQYAVDDTNDMKVRISAKPQITVTTLEKGYLNRKYNVYLQAIGNNLRWSIDDESKLPLGLKLSSISGLIYGTPNGNTGKYTFNLTVKDSNNETDTQECTLEIAPSSESPESITITTVNSDIPNGYVNVRGYSFKFEATTSGTWDMDSVPSGLTFSPSGRLSGTPKTAGDFVVDVSVTDKKGGVDKRSFIISIKTNPEQGSSSQGTGNTGNNSNNTNNGSDKSGGGGCNAGMFNFLLLGLAIKTINKKCAITQQ